MSSKQWRDQILGTSNEDLVRNNGPEFLATLLKRAVQEQRDMIARHSDEMHAYLRANRGALAVVDLARIAKRSGRKTLRVDDVLDAYEGADR